MKKGIQKNKVSGAEPAGRNVTADVSRIESWPIRLVRTGVIVILGILIYSNSFDCSFHLDDRNSIMENTRIRDLSELKTIWEYNPTRFIPYLTLALNYHFHELDVAGYHYLNLAIHLLNACLVWWLISLMFSSPNIINDPIARHGKNIAFIIALLFVSHPLATQSVTYIVQRLASMSALFYLLSLCLYLKGRLTVSKGGGKYFLLAGSIVAGVLGLLSKENAYTLPFAILMAELFFIRSKQPLSYLKDYRLWILIAGSAAMAFAVYSNVSSTSTSGISPSGSAEPQNGIFAPIPPSGGTPFTVTPANYLITQFRVIVTYLRLLLIPTGQNVDHDFSPSTHFFEPATLSGFLFLTALLISAFILYNKQRLISFGIFWFFMTLAVESSIVPIADLIFEHRTYLPSLGFFLVLTAGTYRVFAGKNKYLIYALFTFLILTNSILTYQRNKVWKDEFSLWNDAVTKSPDKARPYLNRGVAYWSQGQREKAMADYEKAIALNPDYFSSAYFNMGVAQAAFNAWDKAIDNYTRAINITPEYTQALDSRGVAYANKMEWDEAIRDFSAAIEIGRGYAPAYYNRGSVYSARSQWKEAIADYSKAIELNPSYLDAYCNRSVAYGNLREWDKAIADCSKSISTDSRYVKGWFNRATTYLNMGKSLEAISDYTTVIQLNPASAAAYYNRGVAYGNIGQFENALADYNKTIQLDPGNRNAYTGLEFAKYRLQGGK